MREETKKKIYQQYRRGESVEALAKQFCRTRTSIYRVIDEMRARADLGVAAGLHPQRAVRQVRGERRRRGSRADARPRTTPLKKARLPSGLPPYLASLYEVPLLTREQEAHLFRKMNYLKYKASELREGLDPARPKSSLMDQIERLYEEVVATKNQIVRANLRLVVSIAKRHVGPAENFFELVSDGNMSLIRAVGEVRLRPGQQVQHLRQLGDHEELRPHDSRRTPPPRPFPHQPCGDVLRHGRRPHATSTSRKSAQNQREAQVEKILERLDEREQKIIISRFGFDRGHEPLTLKEVGAEMGVTKERIRQIEARALGKLRKAAQEEKIEIPGLD